MENHAKDNRFQDHYHRHLLSNQVASSGDKDFKYSSKYKVSSSQRITAVCQEVIEVTENWIPLWGKLVKFHGALIREPRVENEVSDHVLHEKRSKNIGQGRYQQDSLGQENERSEMDGSPREQQDGSSETTSPSPHINAGGKKVTNMAEGNDTCRETSTGLLVVIGDLGSCAFEDNQESKASTYSQNTLKSVLDEVVKARRVPTGSRHRTAESKRRRNPEEKPSEEFLDAESELIENGVDGNNDYSPPSGSAEGRPMLLRALSFICCSFFMSLMTRIEEEEKEESLQAEVQTCSLLHGDLSGEKSHGAECLPQHFLARRCKDRRVLNTEKREVQVICSEREHTVTQVNRYDAKDLADLATQMSCDFYEETATRVVLYKLKDAAEQRSDSKHVATQMDSDSKHMATQVESDPKHMATQMDSDSKHMATQVDSDSKHIATQVDSDSKHIATQVDSDSKHTATQVDSDSKHTATQVDSDSKHIATQVDSDSKHMATQVDSDSKHIATQVDSDSKHIATHVDSDSKHIATQEDSDSKHMATQVDSDSKHIATQVDSDSKLSATQVVCNSKGSSRESNSSDNRKQSAPLVTLSEAMRPVTEILPAEKKPSLLQQQRSKPQAKGLLNARLDLSSSKKNDDNVDDTKEALMMYQRPATSSGLREWVVSMLRAPAEKVASKPPSKQRPSPGFQNEWQRLATFADFQAPSGIFLLPLASNGFFLLPASPAEPRDSSQRVQCAFCGVKVPVRRFLEEGGGSVEEVHQRASPGCRFISGQSRGENVAIADSVHSHELWPLDSQTAASSKNGLSLAPAVPQPRLSEALQTDCSPVSANDDVENTDTATAAAAKDDTATATATAAAADCSSSVATAGRFSATGSCDPKIGLHFNQNATHSSTSATNQAPQFHLATYNSTSSASSSSKGPGISSSNSPSSSSSSSSTSSANLPTSYSVYQSSDANLTPLSSSSSGASTFAAATARSRSSLVDPASADVADFPRPTTTTMPTTTTTTTPIVAGVTTSPSQNSANLPVPSGSASVETGSTAITTTTTTNAANAAATIADAASSAAARSGVGLSSPPSSSSSSSSSSIPASNPSSGSSISASEASFSSTSSSSSSHQGASENLSSAPDSASQTRSRESRERGGESGGESAVGTASSENETERQVVTYEDLGIFATQPKRPDLAVTQIRINTFSRGWPHESTHPAFTMAEAGFYYTSHADLVRCFYCKGGLKTWESEDRPWVEHCRWFPRCPFVRLAKGQRFVEVVQEINTANSQQTISEEQVMQEVARRDREERAKAASQVPPQAATGGEEVTVDPYDEVMRKEGLREGIDIAEERWTEVVTRLEEEQDDIRNDTLCKMCQTEDVNVLFLPCGHLVACAQCAPALKNCAICRQPVKGSVRVQMTVEENADDSEEGR